MSADDTHFVIAISVEACVNETVLVKDIVFRLLVQGKLS